MLTSTISTRVRATSSGSPLVPAQKIWAPPSDCGDQDDNNVAFVIFSAQSNATEGVTPYQQAIVVGKAFGILLGLEPVNGADSRSLANVNDYQPVANISPFGMCVSAVNPAVAAAQGAPQPCLPVITGPWQPGCRYVHHKPGTGAPALALTADSTCSCVFAATIVIANPNTLVHTE
jgi:hypothetical protein